MTPCCAPRAVCAGLLTRCRTPLAACAATLRRYRTRLAVCAGALLLCACGALPRPPALPALHDFGLPPPAARALPDDAVAPGAPARPAPGIVVEAVSAPPWLADALIHYRLLDDEPTQLRAYAQNQWVAPPAQLLRQRLQLALEGAGVATAPVYRLRLQLLEFEQVFASASSATVQLRAIASLRTVDDRLLARRVFDIVVPASPDVQGALHGSAAAVQQLLGQITQWSQQGRQEPARR